jgi:hypothetical protein
MHSTARCKEVGLRHIYRKDQKHNSSSEESGKKRRIRYRRTNKPKSGYMGLRESERTGIIWSCVKASGYVALVRCSTGSMAVRRSPVLCKDQQAPTNPHPRPAHSPYRHQSTAVGEAVILTRISRNPSRFLHRQWRSGERSKVYVLLAAG